MVTAGFALLFGVVGAIVSAGGSFLMGIMPWLAVVVGVGLIFLGYGCFSGIRCLFISLSRQQAKSVIHAGCLCVGFFLFGMAFGAISMSCTLPIFLMVVGSSIAAGDFIGGLFQFVSYILGMGSVMLLLTLGITVVKEGVVVGTLRRIVPYVQKISALLLLGAGAYIVYYWLSSGLLFK